MSLATEDLTPEVRSGEIVHWMDERRVRLGGAGVSPPVLAAFVLGVAATVGLVALGRWLGPRREALPPWRWGRGPLH